MTLTEEQLAEIAARADAATDGPWLWDFYDGFIALRTADDDAVAVPTRLVLTDGAVTILKIEISGADAQFIENARTDVPLLVAEVRRLRARLADVAHTNPTYQGLRDAQLNARAALDHPGGE